MMDSDLSKVDRVEVIDQDGRSYTNYLEEDQSVKFSIQDDGRTLKIFVERNE